MNDKKTEVIGETNDKLECVKTTMTWTQRFVVGDKCVREIITRNPIIIDSDLHPSHSFYKNMPVRPGGIKNEGKMEQQRFLVSANHIYLDDMLIITYLKSSM